MHIREVVVNFFTASDPHYAVALLLKIGLIAGLFLLVHRYKPRWKYAAYFILLVLLVRAALFDQYISWGFYNDHLTVDDVGWRQQSVIDTEYYKFFKHTRKIKFLAVGSSQTYVIYSPYSKDHNELIVFSLAGMSPLDFYLYRKYISDKNPEYVLLYLSEFDLAKEPRLDASKSAPRQGFQLLDILPVLYQMSEFSRSQIDLREMIAGELLPEYKYSFIFRGFLDQFTQKNKALQVQSLYAGLSPDQDQLKKGLDDLTRETDERWIKYNKYFLMKFLSYCRDRSLKVIIVEGQYNPRAYTQRNRSLNQTVHNELEALTKKFTDVIFLSRSDVMPFMPEDYRDSVHVKPEPAYRFVERLMNTLKAAGIQ